MVAQAVGQALENQLPELLDLMLYAGLSESMSKSLADIATYIPHALPGIQGTYASSISDK